MPSAGSSVISGTWLAVRTVLVMLAAILAGIAVGYAALVLIYSTGPSDDIAELARGNPNMIRFLALSYAALLIVVVVGRFTARRGSRLAAFCRDGTGLIYAALIQWLVLLAIGRSVGLLWFLGHPVIITTPVASTLTVLLIYAAIARIALPGEPHWSCWLVLAVAVPAMMGWAFVPGTTVLLKERIFLSTIGIVLGSMHGALSVWQVNRVKKSGWRGL